MKKLKVVCANLLWFIFTLIKVREWEKATRKVSKTQEEYLKNILLKNADTKFGREHCFNDIDSIASFQSKVPIRSYDDLYSYIERIEKGESKVLTSDDVVRFGLSSGSTKASKLVPYTATLISEFQKGINAWFYYLVKQFPRTLMGKTYWSLTPVAKTTEYSSGGIPIGFDDEGAYVSRLAQWVLRTTQTVPALVSHIQEIDSWRYVTLRFLLEDKTLSWISIWNPTFITLCLAPLEKEIDRLISDISLGNVSIELPDEMRELLSPYLKTNKLRAAELKNLQAGWKGKLFTETDHFGKTFYEAVWPNFKLISCWASAEAKDALIEIGKYFPSVSIQPKGLVATEAIVSFPFKDNVSALSLNSHFFEFQEVETGTIRLAHELNAGKQYLVIVTTGGGLYRYCLNDTIQVVGFKNQCPLVYFIGKGDKVVDIRGEKLNAQFVNEVIQKVLSETNTKSTFWMMAPEESKAGEVHYSLFIKFDNKESDEYVLRNLIIMIEKKLRDNYHYNYCRELGQLGCPKLFLIALECRADHIYMNTCAELGQRLGDIKPAVLHSFRHWSEKFEGEFI